MIILILWRSNTNIYDNECQQTRASGRILWFIITGMRSSTLSNLTIGELGLDVLFLSLEEK
jgi:hypothetical protein